MEKKHPATKKQTEPVHQPGVRKGEEISSKSGHETGRHETEHTGKAGRRSGKSTARDSSPITSKERIDPESPHLPTP